MFKKILAFAVLLAPLAVVSAVTQQHPVRRAALQQVNFLPGFTTVNLVGEVAASDCVADSTNPGIETTNVPESAVLVEVRGNSDGTFKASVSLQIPLPATGVACCKNKARDNSEFPWRAAAPAGGA